MPKLPVISGQEMIKALERLGFTQVRQRGSHVVLRRGTTGCVIPIHAELKRGTQMGIIRQAGLTAEEFLKGMK
jgi:predicted RNA binding protein YcfA (HicA-like mRNA interferase family)